MNSVSFLIVIEAVVFKPSAAKPPSSRKDFSPLYVLCVPLSYRNYYTTFHRLCPHKLPQPGHPADNHKAKIGTCLHAEAELARRRVPIFALKQFISNQSASPAKAKNFLLILPFCPFCVLCLFLFCPQLLRRPLRPFLAA